MRVVESTIAHIMLAAISIMNAWLIAKSVRVSQCPCRLDRHAEHRQYLDMWTCSGDLDIHLWCSAPTD